MSHGGPDSKLEPNFRARGDGHHLGLSRVGECSLVAPNIWSINVTSIANIRRRVRGELDGIVRGGASRGHDILVSRRGDTIYDVGVEEIVR